MIEAKGKAKAVIASCKTQDHVNAAEKYIELFYERFEDLLSKQELKNILEEKVLRLY